MVPSLRTQLETRSDTEKCSELAVQSMLHVQEVQCSARGSHYPRKVFFFLSKKEFFSGTRWPLWLVFAMASPLLWSLLVLVARASYVTPFGLQSSPPLRLSSGSTVDLDALHRKAGTRIVSPRPLGKVFSFASLLFLLFLKFSSFLFSSLPPSFISSFFFVPCLSFFFAFRIGCISEFDV